MKCSNCQTTDKSEFAKTQKHRCRKCQNEYSRANYHLNKSRIISQSLQRNRNRTLANRIKLVEYLTTHPCVDCNEADLVVLEFDHTGDKIHNISDMAAASYGWNTILKEIAKCEVVCANCHRRRTAARHGNWHRSVEQNKISVGSSAW